MGRVFRPKYAWTKPNGKRVEKTTKAWYIEYRSAGRTIRRKAGLTKQQAIDALRKIEFEVLNDRNGLPTIQISQVSMPDLLKDYIASISQRAGKEHVRHINADLSRFFNEARVRVFRDITPAAVETSLARLADRDLSATTINMRLIAIKAFLNWAVNTRRLPYNPIACVKRLKGPPRRRRRPLNDDEIGRLLAAALDGPMRRAERKYSNRPRKDGTYKPADIPLKKQAELASEGRGIALAYRLMIEAGLRRNEAACLRWADIDMEEGLLHLREETTKNGKSESLPLTTGLHEALRARKKETGAQDDGLVVSISDRTLRSFDDDLVAAGLATLDPVDDDGKAIQLDAAGKPTREPAKWRVNKSDALGRTYDLHALRHTCGTRLVRNGADIKTVQSLMRHADAAFTLAVYVHKDRTRMAAAVKALPELRPTGLTPHQESASDGIANA